MLHNSCTDMYLFKNWPNHFTHYGRRLTHLHICFKMQLGPQLTKLSLVHTEELDSRAISLLSSQCGNLRQIGFYNCGFREPSRVERERQEQEEAFLAVDRWTVVRDGLWSQH